MEYKHKCPNCYHEDIATKEEFDDKPNMWYCVKCAKIYEIDKNRIIPSTEEHYIDIILKETYKKKETLENIFAGDLNVDEIAFMCVSQARAIIKEQEKKDE